MKTEKKMMTRECSLYTCETCGKESVDIPGVIAKCEQAHKQAECKEKTNHAMTSYEYYYGTSLYEDVDLTVSAKCECGFRSIDYDLDEIPSEKKKEFNADLFGLVHIYMAEDKEEAG